jgi:hypothetical protein
MSKKKDKPWNHAKAVEEKFSHLPDGRRVSLMRYPDNRYTVAIESPQGGQADDELKQDLALAVKLLGVELPDTWK